MKYASLFLFSLIALPALAADIEVANAWLRAPVPGQTVIGGFLDITSRSQDASLVAVSSPIAETTEIHEMSMKQGVMTMRPVSNIPLPQGQTVKLAPGGFHLMLMGLKKSVKAGDKVPLTLKLVAKNKISLHNITAEVRDPLASTSNSVHARPK